MSIQIFNMRRKPTWYEVVVANGAAISNEINADGYAGAVVIVPAAWTAANIGFKIAQESGGTYVILRDYAGNPVQISGIKTDGTRAYEVPPEVFAAVYIKLWSKSTTMATETDTNQGAERTIQYILKS